MATSKANKQATLNHSEITDLICFTGDTNTVLVRGPTGIGKSSLLQMVLDRKRKSVPNMVGAYIDCANLSFGDTMMPVINKDDRCTGFYPNEHFKLHLGVPVCIMLDEYLKGTRDVKNMLLPLMLERRLGSTVLHKDSLVFASSNLQEEGLGDDMQAHVRNRITEVELRSPTSEEWCAWGMENGAHATLLAFAHEFSQIFQSYRDDTDGSNPYIYNPKKVQRAVCTPRSLFKCNSILANRTSLSSATLHAALSGTVGVNTANSMMTFVNLEESLPDYKEILANPSKCPIPDSPPARLLLIFSMLVKVTKTDLKAVMEYVDRFNAEMHGIFVNRILSTPSTSVWAAQHPSMAKAVGKLKNIW